MASDYRGLYLIGDKKTGRITDVQVEDDGEGINIRFRSAVYLVRGVEPVHRTLPWQEDIKATRARPVSHSWHGARIRLTFPKVRHDAFSAIAGAIG